MHSVLKTVLSVILYFVGAILASLCMLPAIIKHRLTLWIYGQHGDILAHPFDTLYFTESAKTTTIYWMVELEGQLGLKQLQKHVMEQCHKQAERLGKFCSVPVLEHGSLIWRKDKNFKIENHVKQHWPVAQDDDDLKKAVQFYLDLSHTGDLFPNDESMSPWQIQLVNVKDESSVLLFFIGHSLTDGVGCMNLFNQLLTDKSGTIPQPKAWRNASPLTRVWTCATNILEVLMSMNTEQSTFLVRKNITPLKEASFNCSKPVSITKLRKLKEILGPVTVNDITCGVIWRAVNRYTTMKDIKVSQPLIKFMQVASLRESQEDYTPVNHTGTFTLALSLETGDHKPVKELVKHIAKACSSIKSIHPLVLNQLFVPYCRIISLSMETLNKLVKSTDGCCDVFISNIAGPRNAVMMMGKGVKRITFLPPSRTTSGLSFSVSSYNDELRVSILDRIGVADTALFMGLVNTAFDELLADFELKPY